MTLSVLEKEELIKKRAFEIYQSRMANGQFLIVDRCGCREINEKDDWFLAEQEIEGWIKNPQAFAYLEFK